MDDVPSRASVQIGVAQFMLDMHAGILLAHEDLVGRLAPMELAGIGQLAAGDVALRDQALHGQEVGLREGFQGMHGGR